MVGAILVPLAACALVTVSVDEEFSAERGQVVALPHSPTARTVPDERQLRIVAEAIPGPEVAAGAARGRFGDSEGGSVRSGKGLTRDSNEKPPVKGTDYEFDKAQLYKRVWRRRLSGVERRRG